MDMSKAKWQGNWLVERVAETGSTNADLLAGLSLDVPHRYVLNAEHQTAGRGRLGRQWEAPPGSNLLVSILFRDVAGPPHRLTQHVGLAAAMVLHEAYGLNAGLKWPNDVVVTRADGDDVKIAGILAQMAISHSSTVNNNTVNVVVGMGLNVRWAPPPEVAYATCVANEMVEAGIQETDVPSPQDVLTRILQKFDEIDGLDERESFELYRRHLRTLGKTVRCQMPNSDDIVGRALDVGADGRLEVLDDCAITHHIDTADVIHLRPA